ncbi:MAG: PAS domain S-box protein [Alphaproteobacteria bacterium]|nr:PAS domain S-box protein [Alphaproteobacteria bacterium]
MIKDMFGPARRNEWLVLSALALAAVLIFAADLSFAHRYTVWVLYLPLCVGAAWLDRPREAVAASAIATILIATGWLLAPDAGPAIFPIVSRTLEAVTIWLAVALVLLRQQSARTIEAAFRTAREANDRLSGIIINNAEDAIICIDDAQRITLFNQGAERIFGYTTDEAVGKPLTILLPIRAADSHEAYVRQFGVSAVHSRRMGERGAVAGVRKDGTEFPAEISISKLSTPVGMVYTAILRDISERIKAEELFRERERRLRIALSAGQMGTFDVNELTSVVRQDETALRLLRLPATQIEVPIEDYFRQIHPQDIDAVRERHAQVRRAGGDFHMEYRVLSPDGSVRWLASQGTCELDARGEPRRTTGVTYDITDTKLVEEALGARVAERTAELRKEIAQREGVQADLLRSQKLQAVGELTGGMAHDFNNLLTIITGNLELLGLRQLDDKAHDLIRRAEGAAKMGARLASRLLAIGRRQRLQPISLDLNEVARSMSDVLTRTLGDEIEIRTSLAENLMPALADISEVENAILNLAINARDAMPNGGKLIIATANASLGPDDVAGEAGLKPGNYVLLSVADTGVGMSPDVLAHAFEPYFTTKGPGRGTGLGLSTIYGFAKQSGGHLTIYSEVGKGTSVRLYLPQAGAPAQARVDAAPTNANEAARGETILVVEDNPEVRDVTVKRLDLLGYGVLTAENAPAAIAVLESDRKVDLVFSDVVMPGGMSGFDLAQWVRRHRPDIRVLLTSGFTGDVAKNGEKSAQDVDVLRKPYATAELAQAIREALS